MRTLLAGIVFLLFAVTLGSNALAQNDIGFYGIGGKLGFVMPEGDGDNTIALGVISDLGTITPLIHLSASLDYWSVSNFRQISIGGTTKYLFPIEGDIKPYAGGGLNLIFWKADSVSDTDIGIDFVGGVEKELSPNLIGFGEVKYHIDGADYIGLFAGVTYLLGK